MQQRVSLRETRQSVKKVTYVIPIEHQRLTMKWIGIPFYIALFMGFQSTTVVDKLGIIMRLLRTTINKNNFHLRATQL